MDQMDISTPTNSSPSTPKPRPAGLVTPPRLYKSDAIVISLSSSPEPEASAGHDNSYYPNEYQQNYTTASTPTPTSFSGIIPEIDEPTYTPTGTPPPDIIINNNNNNTNITNPRPRTYAFHPSFSERKDRMSTSQTLDHISLSPQPPNPPLKVLLVLTPNPARLSELKALEAFAQQFCEDFSSSSSEEYSQEEWCCINLYAHFRECVAMRETGDASDDSELGDADGVKRHCENNEDLEVGIGFIHPYALLEKLDQEKEVQWRLAIPVLRGLIDREVEKGARAFVVSGLRVGDVEGVRAFGKSIAKPAGILAFLPPPPPPTADDEYEPELPLEQYIVPSEYQSKTVTIPSAPLSQTYDALLAALFAKQLSLTSEEQQEGGGAGLPGQSLEVRRSAGSAGDDDYGDLREEDTMDWV